MRNYLSFILFITLPSCADVILSQKKIEDLPAKVGGVYLTTRSTHLCKVRERNNPYLKFEYADFTIVDGSPAPFLQMIEVLPPKTPVKILSYREKTDFSSHRWVYLLMEVHSERLSKKVQLEEMLGLAPPRSEQVIKSLDYLDLD